ncbi:MAG: hypothetical protein CO137_01250 [Candidatus Magasanikbacteria bacterium CG_4_9_14_3_um_filter_32_9]|uniref:C2H2-type domain-containing protein n=1 Tax=Candidatus Magasanikbacteria bacterium CG_4_9_14_3_um_filter_32_9 TaxID=1974644 RepID=A0A2M7Z790_9BACT|nr:hypothetical protein [Ignavibacteria bacterium]PJA90009.1 MAG: hypothetical protein CO137_01250 [Candidatus Magasanikbacteria bacterium CG_4_9_14_3_um_filter_32_9]
MGTIVFILFAVIVVAVTIYLSLREKKKCPNCESQNITKTGKKIHEEETSIAVISSPTSYHKFEYKCNDCGHLFLIKQRSLLFE